ncbi:hypothetical protein [Streptomyces sp. NPDC002853]
MIDLPLSALEVAMVEAGTSASDALRTCDGAAREPQQAHGTPTSVGSRLARIAEDTGADELMLVTPVYDLADRVRSFALVRELSTGPAT